MLGPGEVVCAALAAAVPAPSVIQSQWYTAYAEATDVEYSRAALNAVWLSAAVERISDFASLPEDWSGYGCDRPSATAISISRNIVSALVERDHRPGNAVPMADGGIMMNVAAGERVVRLDIYNDGGIAIVTSAAPGEPLQYDDIEEALVADAVVDFLRSV